MKNSTLLGFLLIITLGLHAQIDGPLNGGSFSIVAIPGSNQTWNNPGNTSTSDNSYSNFNNITGPIGAYTNYLVATNFGFNIPLGVSMSGIIVEIERSDPNFRTADYSVRIVKGGTIGTTEKATGSSYPSSDSYQSFGNAGDLWGESWTVTDINSANFGVAVAAQRSATGGITAGRIDHIRITVFYNFMLLPVRLISFTSLKKDHSVEITWTTTDEKDINHYELERSATTNNFQPIKSVTSRNQSQQTTYSVTDKSPLNGVAYYRLKTIEDNGKIAYSKIISVKPGSGTNNMLYPSAWKNGTPLHINNPENKKLEIYFIKSSGQFAGKVITNFNEIPTDVISNTRGLLYYKVLDEKGYLYGSGILKAF